MNGRNSIDTHEKIAYDIEYIRNRSFWFDVYILLRTPAVILGRRGAY